MQFKIHLNFVKFFEALSTTFAGKVLNINLLKTQGEIKEE